MIFWGLAWFNIWSWQYSIPYKHITIKRSIQVYCGDYNFDMPDICTFKLLSRNTTAFNTRALCTCPGRRKMIPYVKILSTQARKHYLEFCLLFVTYSSYIFKKILLKDMDTCSWHYAKKLPATLTYRVCATTKINNKKGKKNYRSSTSRYQRNCKNIILKVDKRCKNIQINIEANRYS